MLSSSPVKAAIMPKIEEVANTLGRRSEINNAADAGVISMATTNITPTLLKDATTDNESNNMIK